MNKVASGLIALSATAAPLMVLLMQFDLIPVGPLSPLGLLSTAAPAPDAQGN